MISSDLPTVSAAQMAEVDRLLTEQFGIQLIQVMENAGRSLAEQAFRMLGGALQGRKVVVLCGAGNNGGGGMVAARHLHDRGAAVQAILAGSRDHLKRVPAQQLQALDRLGLATDNHPNLASADLIVDALIGYGLRGEPRGDAAGWIDSVNQAGRPVLALDVPSGLDSDSGRPSVACVQATATLTLALPKAGLLLPPARPNVGDLYLADIGVPPELYREVGIDAKPWFELDSIIQVA